MQNEGAGEEMDEVTAAMMFISYTHTHTLGVAQMALWDN